MADNDAKKMVRLNYSAYLADTDRLFDTTVEEVAKENDVYNEKYSYSPMAFIVGSGKLFPALEAAITAAEVGKEVEVVIPCEEAAGVKNPKLVEVYPIRDFYKQEINPYPGAQVTLGNRTGIIASVGAGRVKVDFNNPLAGHDLKYIFTIVENIDKDEDKARAIIEVNFADSEGFSFEFPGDKIVVTVSDITKFHQDWPVARFKIVTDLRALFGVDTVEFVEIWSVAKKEE